LGIGKLTINTYCERVSIKKVVNKSKREYNGRDLMETFFLINNRVDIIGRIINNASIGIQANSNMTPITAN